MTLKIYGHSVTGPHHKREGSPNQDFYYHLEDDKRLVLAVADGAGSLPLSHFGAEIASKKAVEIAFEDTEHKKLKDVVRYAFSTARCALENHKDFRDLGCTLALVVLDKETNEWAIGVVGDSFVVIHKVGGSHELITSPKESEFANITRLLTSGDPTPLLATGDFPVIGFSLSSDGLTHSTIKGGLPFQKFWDMIVAKATQDELSVPRLFDWIDEQGRIDDDTTLLVAVNSGG